MHRWRTPVLRLRVINRYTNRLQNIHLVCLHNMNGPLRTHSKIANCTRIGWEKNSSAKVTTTINYVGCESSPISGGIRHLRPIFNQLIIRKTRNHTQSFLNSFLCFFFQLFSILASCPPGGLLAYMGRPTLISWKYYSYSKQSNELHDSERHRCTYGGMSR